MQRLFIQLLMYNTAAPAAADEDTEKAVTANFRCTSVGSWLVSYVWITRSRFLSSRRQIVGLHSIQRICLVSLFFRCIEFVAWRKTISWREKRNWITDLHKWRYINILLFTPSMLVQREKRSIYYFILMLLLLLLLLLLLSSLCSIRCTRVKSVGSGK